MKVIKRDGTPQEYSFIKIADAIRKAFNSILIVNDTNINQEEYLIKLNELKLKQQPEISKFLEQVKESVEKVIIKNNGNGTPIEEIQDTIQKELIKRNKYEVVESFINYRRKREEIREQKSDLMKQIEDKLYAKNVQNQNANLDEASFGGRLGETAGTVAKDQALKKMSKTSRKNHEGNMIYEHDLDHWMVGDHNCLSLPFDYLLGKGFKTRQTDVRPAGSINTAMQLEAVIFQLQSLQQFGGVGGTHIDWTMVPYVRKSFRKHYITNWIQNLDEFYDLDILSMDYEAYKHWIENKVTEFYLQTKLEDEDFKFANKTTLDLKIRQRALDDTKKETYQAVEGMYHNLNTLQSRSGNQLPFTSINYGTCTELEGRMVIRALLDVSMEGLGSNGVTSIFPCGIFQYKKGINDKPGTPNYDLKRLALKSTAMRIYPNYANADWSNNANALKMDRDQKQDYINSLDAETYNKLYNKVGMYPNKCMEKLGLYIDKDSYIVVDRTERPIEFFNTMGCRTVNLFDINALDNFKRNIQCVLEGRFDDIDDVFSAIQKDGRGNICPVTIIMPTLAAMIRKKLEKKWEDSGAEYVKGQEYEELIFNEFMKLLDKKIHEAKDMLLERFNHICSQSPKSARFMYENHTMAGYHKEEGIISALKHGTIVIGQIGMSETLYLLFGYDHTTTKGMKYAKKIEQLFLDRTSEFKKEYKLNFGNYYTPAENLCYTSFNKFRKAYPEFDLEGVTYFTNSKGEKEYKQYFTNSIHVPVYHNCDVFEKIDIESQLTGYSNAGCITYVELDSTCYNNIDAIEKIVDYAMEHDIPYFALNIPLNRCAECGEPIYDEELDECPKCGCNKIIRLGRITGYLSTTIEHFNKGKQKEFKDRVDHIGQSIYKCDC